MTHTPATAHPAKGLHYRLTSEEWLSVSSELRFAEIKVLYYLRTLDPFGDRQLDLRVVDIADALKLTKGTVSKALQVLGNKDYIDLELVTVRVRLNSKKFPGENEVSCGKPEILEETSESWRKLPDSVGNFEQPEALPDAGSESPHTLQTNQTDLNKRERSRDLINQDGEPREDFAEWLKNRANQLPQKPALLEVWIQKQATKKANQRAFLKYRESLQKIDVPPAPATPTQPMTEPMTEAEKRQNSLARLQAKWKNPAWRKSAIAEAEGWGFVVTEDGIQDPTDESPAEDVL